MSRWRTGRINLTCSLDVLQKALIGIMPEWKDRIKTDPDGKIIVQTVGAGPQECHLSVASGYGDQSVIGFKKDADGTWQIFSTDYNDISENDLRVEIATQAFKENALKRNGKLITEEATEEGTRMIFFIPQEGATKFTA